MPSAKIAVLGDLNGHFRAVIEKLNALHSKNAFSFAITAGNLFGPSDADSKDVDDLLNGHIPINLPVYFALGTNALPEAVVSRLAASDDGSLCPNLYFLGKRTTTKTSEGVRIVALGGALDANIATADTDKEAAKYLPFYTEQDAKVLKGARHADILLTSQWPADIRTGSKVVLPEDNEDPTSQTCIAELCDALRPRYHFSTSANAFYEREPFFHARKEGEDEESGYHSTRFLSLASYGNAYKQKWIYAFSIDPSTPPTSSIPTGTTASPFTFLTQQKRKPLPSQEARYNHDGGDRYERPRKRHKRDRAPPPTQGECYFCLSNPNLPTHLITSIGSEAYLTTAKGPLPTSSTYPSLPFPSHILIIPMSHSPTLSLIPDTDAKEATRTEMTKNRRAIQDMISSVSKGKLGALTWEISRASGFHTHWQLLPLPQTLISKNLVEAAFRVEAEAKSHPPPEKGDPDESVDYFRLWIWDAEKKEERGLWFALDAGFRDLQYARRVVAKLLGLEGRVMWQDCGQTAMEEERDAEAFKEAFKAFDFTESEG